MNTGQRVAVTGMVVSGGLAALKIGFGLTGHSSAVVADGLESGGDVFASGFVLLGLTIAAKPPDEDHPYGHGRIETLTGLMIGLFLAAGGSLISFSALQKLGEPHPPLAAYVVWPLFVSLLAKIGLSWLKFHYGRRLKSAALIADAWNDGVDTISAISALAAVGLALANPARFMDADRYGAFIVGLIVIFAGARVAHETAMQLIDTMPDDKLMQEVRRAAKSVAGVHGVEKCFARKTGLRYHVDLHLEVDPDLTVRQSHDIAHDVRQKIVADLDWVADVLVHVEPAP